jgi:hypothetical protein
MASCARLVTAQLLPDHKLQVLLDAELALGEIVIG